MNAKDVNVKMIEDMIGTGTGLYTLDEVAKYARMSTMTLGRWFRGDGYCKRVFPFEDSDLITFADFVQVLAVRSLRVHYHLSLQKIRDAVDRASAEYKIEHPFARKHKTFLFEKEIWIEVRDEHVVQISGKSHGQEGMKPVIESFYDNVSFDPVSGIASRYKAFERGNDKIVMNPKIRFGEPILEGVGYTPQALYEASKTEGSIEAAAKSYGVSAHQVRTCIEFFDHLSMAA